MYIFLTKVLHYIFYRYLHDLVERDLCRLIYSLINMQSCLIVLNLHFFKVTITVKRANKIRKLNMFLTYSLYEPRHLCTDYQICNLRYCLQI